MPTAGLSPFGSMNDPLCSLYPSDTRWSSMSQMGAPLNANHLPFSTLPRQGKSGFGLNLIPLHNFTLNQRTKFRLVQIVSICRRQTINMIQILSFVLGRTENIMGKGENAGYQHFLLFPKCFQKFSKKCYVIHVYRNYFERKISTHRIE